MLLVAPARQDNFRAVANDMLATCILKGNSNRFRLGLAVALFPILLSFPYPQFLILNLES